MPAYVLATIDVHDPGAYAEQYAPPAGATVMASGGVILAAGGDCQIVEGDVFLGRNVILGFADTAAALAWYRSPEYQAVLPRRLETATSSLVVVEGTDDAFTPGASYAIATMDLVDPEPYSSAYAPTALKTVGEQGGTVLVRGGATEVLEGDAFGPRTVVISFPDYGRAKAWYHLPEYQAVVGIRLAATKDNGLVLVEGWAP